MAVETAPAPAATPAAEVKPAAPAPAAAPPPAPAPQILTDAPPKPQPETKAAPDVKPAEPAKPSADPAAKPAAPPSGEVKPPTAEPPKPVVYDLKLPEKSLLTKADVDAMAAHAKEKGLAPEQAQALLNERSQAVAQYVEVQTKNLAEQSSKVWVEQLRSDKDFGGDKFNQTCELAHRAFTRFADADLVKDVKATGLANHPAFVKAWARVGRAMAEDKIIPGNGQPGAGRAGKALADRLYPDQGKK